MNATNHFVHRAEDLIYSAEGSFVGEENWSIELGDLIYVCNFKNHIFFGWVDENAIFCKSEAR